MKHWKTPALHLLLFLLTLLTTTLAGSEWIHGRAFFVNENGLGWSEWMTFEKFSKGFLFSVPFLGFLTVHEFGHYFTARMYKVKVSLPYYIPLWLGISSTLGTAGAFIQIKGRLISRQQFFDIGIAGPLAGFVIALGVLVYGFLTLPPPEYIFEIHPEYKVYGLKYADFVYRNLEGQGLAIGKNLLFVLLEYTLVAEPARIPSDYEIVHYPFLFAGYMGLLFTALNLIPIGQLDGGHILYGLTGFKLHARIAPVLFVLFVAYAGLGMITPYDSLDTLALNIPFYVGFLYIVFGRTLRYRRDVLLLSMSVFTVQFLIALFLPTLTGYSGWFAFALLLGRFLGVYHPAASEDAPLNRGRRILGILALLIFVLCFSPRPFIFE